jgi:hypothetical protein
LGVLIQLIFSSDERIKALKMKRPGFVTMPGWELRNNPDEKLKRRMDAFQIGICFLSMRTKLNLEVFDPNLTDWSGNP